MSYTNIQRSIGDSTIKRWYIFLSSSFSSYGVHVVDTLRQLRNLLGLVRGVSNDRVGHSEESWCVEIQFVDIDVYDRRHRSIDIILLFSLLRTEASDAFLSLSRSIDFSPWSADRTAWWTRNSIEESKYPYIDRSRDTHLRTREKLQRRSFSTVSLTWGEKRIENRRIDANILIISEDPSFARNHLVSLGNREID